MYTQKVKTLEPFSFHVIPVKTMETYLGEHLNVMVQALYIQDGTLLFDELDLSGLASWAPKLADKAHQLLAEYHDVFSLYPAELGCTHSTEHTIEVTDDTPFKEHFR